MRWLIYNLIFPLVFLAMLPHFIKRMCRRGGYAKDFMQRLGRYSPEVDAKLRAMNAPVWVHAVSVGEIMVAFSFMETFRAKHPRTQFVLTTNTSTAHALASKRIAEQDLLLYFPIDLPWVIASVLRKMAPAKLLLVECELWPNMLRGLAKRAVPLHLINGRMSDKSFSGYQKLSAFTKPLLALFDGIVVQGDRDAQRYLTLGAHPDCIHTLGAAKYDVAPASVPCADFSAYQVPADALVWVAASTWPGEESMVLALYKKLRAQYPKLFLVLVPRHAERAPDILPLFDGLTIAQRSIQKSAEMCPDLLLADTTGELLSFYAAADLVFVGKSMPPNQGGQNPIEPAALGKPVLVGSEMQNFPSIMDDFKQANALIQVTDALALEAELLKLLQDEAERESLGQRAKALVESKRGVMKRTVNLCS